MISKLQPSKPVTQGKAWTFLRLALVFALAFALEIKAAHSADDKAKSGTDLQLDEGTTDNSEPMPMPEPNLGEAVPESDQKPAVAAPPSKSDSESAAPEAESSAPVEQATAPEGEKAGKARFQTTKNSCPMHAKASKKSGILTKVPAGRKVWTEPVGPGWVRVHRKSGEAAYLPTGCF